MEKGIDHISIYQFNSIRWHTGQLKYLFSGWYIKTDTRFLQTKQYSVGVYEIIEETVQFKPDFCALSEKKQHGTTVRVERKIMMNAVGVMENEEHQEGKHHQQYRREIPRSIPECSALHICSNVCLCLFFGRGEERHFENWEMSIYNKWTLSCWNVKGRSWTEQERWCGMHYWH